ncbi:MAG: PEP/pyruvate-binding domain-containing protein [Deinococcales bacterium]
MDVPLDIVWFDDQRSRDIALVGGKAASLSRLASGHRVPPGFCLTTAAYDAWSRTARPAHRQAGSPLPQSLRAALRDAYAELGRRCGADPLRVAVRSSAIDEDGVDASFAGQHETFLNIVGVDAVTEALIGCWSSGRSQRALAYREGSGLDANGIHLAVLVQQLVPADAAAVVFSADPVSGRREEVVIDANFGLGESIVGGSVTPDAYRVDKRSGAVVDRSIGSKTVMHIPVPGGTREVPVPRPLRAQPALTDEQCAACAALACSLEAEMGHPVDVECAFHDGQLYLLQCRAITRLPSDPNETRAPDRHGEHDGTDDRLDARP